MPKKIFDVKNERATLLEKAQGFIDEGNTKEYDETMNKVKDLNEEIHRLEVLDVERGRFSDGNADAAHAYQMMEQKKEDDKINRSLDDVLSDREYTHCFLNAIRNNVTRKDVMGGLVGEQYNPLRNALTIAGNPEGGQDGGFLVPIDMSTKINEYRRTMVQLADYVNVENVTAPTGFRPFDTAPTKGFTKITGELKPIPEDDQPKFAQIEYKTNTYGLFIQLSQQLVQDEDANLLNYLARWFSKKQVITENEIIIDKLSEAGAMGANLSPMVDAMTHAFSSLDPAIADQSKIMMANSVFYSIYAATLKEKIFELPNVADSPFYRYMGHDIIRIPDEQCAKIYQKVLVGDFKQYMTLFRRKYLELDSTTVGGNAWRNYGYEVRGITRLGATIFDKKAVVGVDADLNEPSESEEPSA